MTASATPCGPRRFPVARPVLFWSAHMQTLHILLAGATRRARFRPRFARGRRRLRRPPAAPLVRALLRSATRTSLRTAPCTRVRIRADFFRRLGPQRASHDCARRRVLNCSPMLPVLRLRSRAAVRDMFPQVRGGRCRSRAAGAKYRLHNGFFSPSASASGKRIKDPIRRLDLTPHAPMVPSTPGVRRACFSCYSNDTKRLVLAGKSGCSEHTRGLPGISGTCEISYAQSIRRFSETLLSVL